MKQEAEGNREEVPPGTRRSRVGIPAVHGGGHVHYWWLGIAHHNIINPTELPDGWGLLLPDRNGQLQTAVPARRRDPAELPRTLVAALLRAAVKTAARSAPPTTTEPLEGTPT